MAAMAVAPKLATTAVTRDAEDDTAAIPPPQPQPQAAPAATRVRTTSRRAPMPTSLPPSPIPIVQMPRVPAATNRSSKLLRQWLTLRPDML